MKGMTEVNEWSFIKLEFFFLPAAPYEDKWNALYHSSRIFESPQWIEWVVRPRTRYSYLELITSILEYLSWPLRQPEWRDPILGACRAIFMKLIILLASSPTSHTCASMFIFSLPPPISNIFLHNHDLLRTVSFLITNEK